MPAKHTPSLTRSNRPMARISPQRKPCPFVLSILSILPSLFLLISTASAEGIKNETELGVVLTSGNSKTSSSDLKQSNSYGWDSHFLKLGGNYLRTTTDGILKAKNWGSQLKWEEKISGNTSGYAGVGVESNPFAGFNQRHSSDLGLKYSIWNNEEAIWAFEAGYRLTIENLVAGSRRHLRFLRTFSEISAPLNPNVSGKLSAEFLPGLAEFSDYRLNVEPSLSAMLAKYLSFKVGYRIRYTNQPLPGAAFKTDTAFTTALVAQIK